jgi:hypothetical protein
MVVFDPLDVLEQYPDLADAIVNEAGVLPPFLIRPVKVAAADEAADEPVPEPDMKPSERTGTAEDPQEMAQADAAAASDGETTSATPAVVSQPEEFPLQTDEDELRARRSNVLRHTGAVLTGVGFLADAGALALSFFGDDLFSTWPGNGEDVLTPIAYGGGGLVTVGLLMYAVATIIGN